MNPKISLFRGSFDARALRTVPLDAILGAIRQGAYRDAIERLRRIRAAYGQAAYKSRKEKLDAVTFAGTFLPTRAKANLVQPSGAGHGDLDHLPHLAEARARICADPHTVYCFVSPGGDGLKVGVRIPLVADDDTYKRYWQAIADYHQQRYGLPWDPSGKDVCRLCYLSWDPELYYNPAAPPFPVLPGHTALPRPIGQHILRHVLPRDQRTRYAQQALNTAITMIAASTPGNRHHARTRAAYLLGGYVAGGILSYDEARATLAAAVDRNSKHPRRAMRTIDDCLAAGMQAAISLENLERERRAWLAANWHKRARVWTGRLVTIHAQAVPSWR